MFNLFSNKQKQRDDKEILNTSNAQENEGADVNANIDLDIDPEIIQSVENDLQKDGQVFRLDNRGLEPPKPMMRTLHQLSTMKQDEILMITIERVPVFLFEELDHLGYTYSHEKLSDGAVEITIQKVSE